MNPVRLFLQWLGQIIQYNHSIPNGYCQTTPSKLRCQRCGKIVDRHGIVSHEEVHHK
jgi:hypothetical protein